jgi:pimeloyl-ACP methyl ester carboxylesterase
VNKTFKRGLRWFGIALVVLSVMFNALAYNHAKAMLCFTETGEKTRKPEALSFWTKAKLLFVGVNIPRPTSAIPSKTFDPNCQVLTISMPDAVSLEAWYCNRGPETPLVIMFHGYMAEKTCLIKDAQALLELGCSVLLVDFRGSGGSSESYTTIGIHEAEDVAAAVNYAKASLPHSSTVLLGKSMGAVAILRAAHLQTIEPDAVILEAVFDTLLHTIQNRFAVMGAPAFPGAELLIFWGGIQWNFNGFNHNPVDYAPSLTCPSLFMHGNDDPRARLSEGKSVFAAAPEPKLLKVYNGVGHESYIEAYPDVWRATVRNFLNSVIH